MRTPTDFLCGLFRVGVLGGLMLGLSACAAGPQIRVDRVSSKDLAPTSLVRTLTTPPSGPYTVIAKLRVRGAPGESRIQLLSALTKKAGSLGANALLLTAEHRESLSTGPVQFNPAGGSYAPSVPQTVLEIHAEALLLGSAVTSKSPVKP